MFLGGMELVSEAKSEGARRKVRVLKSGGLTSCDTVPVFLRNASI